MRWVVIGGEWMFSFFFPLLAFSLVYFVGLVSQSSDIPLSIKSQIKKAFHTLRREDIPIKKKHSYSSKVQVDGESDYFREFEQIEHANMNWKMLTHRAHWSVGSVCFSFTLSRNEIFVFTWIFRHMYLRHSHRQSHRAAMSYKKGWS